MAVKWANNATTTIASGISSGATTITVAGGGGSLFPSIGAGDYFYATLNDSSNNIEIVKVTSRSGDVMTVVRGQDGTTAQAWIGGDKFELRPTAAGLQDSVSNLPSGAQVDGVNIVTVSGTQTLTNKTLESPSLTGVPTAPTATLGTDNTQIASTAFVNAAIADNKAVPTGTKMLFAQTSAPTGWTKDTTHDNKALRVVSGTAGSGGTVDFTTAFSSKSVGGTIGSTTLTTAQTPSHTHVYYGYTPVSKGSTGTRVTGGASTATTNSSHNTGATGGGGSHNHTFSGTAIDLSVQYVDVIIASKD
jgi:hypothetical protein